MKIRIIYFIISVLLILLTGCSTPDKLPAILPYEITGEKYDTSALIEYLPHPDDRVNRFMLENLKNNGYTVLQGAITALKPKPINAHGACSRDEPLPKLSLATRIVAPAYSFLFRLNSGFGLVSSSSKYLQSWKR